MTVPTQCTAPPVVQVSWDAYHALIERLAVQIHASGWHFDAIVGVARGGLRVGDVLSRLFRRPLGVVFTSSYREDAGLTQGALHIADHLSSAQPLPGPEWLIVDDLVDTGTTLVELARILPRRYPQAQRCRTAVLWSKAGALVSPDYCVERLAGRPWISQPFERYDREGVEALVETVSRTEGS